MQGASWFDRELDPTDGGGAGATYQTEGARVDSSNLTPQRHYAVYGYRGTLITFEQTECGRVRAARCLIQQSFHMFLAEFAAYREGQPDCMASAAAGPGSQGTR